ncbi:uncharacterized protein LOC111992570 [Quercus suber]|uniref:uncharacterized protein LOC111992570 n=1 Tax=Quercus suber TaxID=58331 RepID=UPI000CE18C50|nr:uncharacterized protein LOC111992570 [Quercus suber]
MAEEVIDSLENMRLTANEEDVIAIPDEERKAKIESCTLSLIGKFLTCKPFNKKAAKNTIWRAWGLEKELQIVDVGSNLFQFKFQIEFDLERIFKGGLWTFDNQLLMLKRWQKGMNASNAKIDHASLWVQIWRVLFDMSSPQVAALVGSKLGVLEEVEKRSRQDDQNYFMRVRVGLPISKPLRRGAYLAGWEGERVWVTFKYERLPLFCHFCGFLGHDIRHCVGYFTAKKREDSVQLQYGEWLRVVGGASTVSTKENKAKWIGGCWRGA